jgi:putative membrane protein
MSPRSVVASASALAALAGMIATPLLARGSDARAVLAWVVVLGLFGGSFAAAAGLCGWRRASCAASAVLAVTVVVEAVGTRTGVPFGHYDYTGALGPRIALVPVLVPFAWFAMALPAREVAVAIDGTGGRLWLRVALGAVALTAWDLFLDPQMVGEGYWTWPDGGAYRGVPLGNYAGWLLTSAAVMLLLERLLPPQRASRAAVAQYAVVAVMQTIGFAAFFGDAVVAAVGGAAMLPIAAAAVMRVRRTLQ